MKPDEALWMVIYMARGARQADSVEALLHCGGISGAPQGPWAMRSRTAPLN